MVGPLATDRWRTRLASFRACHEDELDVLLHAVTSPVGLLGAMMLVDRVLGTAALVVAGVAYALSLIGTVPRSIWAATVALLVPMAALATYGGPWMGVALILAGWTGQSLAHAITGEPTFESTYAGRKGAWSAEIEHTWLLLPLVLAALGSTAAMWVPKREAVQFSLGRTDAIADMDAIAAWVRARPSRRTTSHWWASDLPSDLAEAFMRLAAAPEAVVALRGRHGPRCTVSVIPAMNEVYVSAPPSGLGSDEVFAIDHVDGPFAVFPLCAVYRCILAIGPNERVTTRLSQSGDEATLGAGQALAFDYHRTVHRIDFDGARPDHGPRIVLKVHLLVHPAGLAPWGRLLAALSTAWNTAARLQFDDAIAPRSAAQRAKAHVIVAGTRLYAAAQRHLGLTNVAYVAAAALLAILSDFRVFLVVTSFVHYAMYLGVFHVRRDIAFGTFKRDVVFFKAISMISLAAACLSHWELGPSLVIAAAGFLLAGWSARILGVDRTYYGAELGIVPPARIHRFPYGTIPHPMILGSVVGLLGLYAMQPFREAFPWLVPVHVALYAAVLAQESFDSRAVA